MQTSYGEVERSLQLVIVDAVGDYTILQSLVTDPNQTLHT